MVVDPSFVITAAFGIVISVIGFFLIRLITKTDDSIITLSGKFEAVKSQITLQGKNQELHEMKVNTELGQVKKDVEKCLVEIKSVHQLQFDVNNIGTKLRKIEKSD